MDEPFSGRRLQCHHCGARQAPPLACPACGSLALQPQGIGTERLEKRLVEAFPEQTVVRIDHGPTQRRCAPEQQLTELGNAPGILVGTQILAKDRDLSMLTMVVAVGIDEELFSADFRASQKLAQQLIQAPVAPAVPSAPARPGCRPITPTIHCCTR